MLHVPAASTSVKHESEENAMKTLPSVNAADMNGFEESCPWCWNDSVAEGALCGGLGLIATFGGEYGP